MLGGVYLGLLAACIVLFVPMGMAGWHLSRNKILFFSGALFITLAVCVHLTPYFPSISDFVSSVQSVVVFDNRADSCINLINEVVWNVKPRRVSNEFRNISDNLNGSVIYDKVWDWARTGKVRACEFQRLERSDTRDLLNGSWVVVAGDSQARLIVQSLLNLILDSKRMESIKADLFKRHSDYQIVVKEVDLKLDFIWAPYVVNLTDLITRFNQNRSYPDVLVIGAGLWHMLHITNSSNYGSNLQTLRNTVVNLLPISAELGKNEAKGLESIRSMHMFWLGMPMLINGMLNTEEKREKMTDEMWHLYDKETRNSKLLRVYGGPFVLLDIQSMSWNCGPRCTDDGMHYDRAVYEAAVHVLLNGLLIESHQNRGSK